MTLLDCETFDTALQSMAEAVDRPASAVVAALRGFDPTSVIGADPDELVAPALLRPLGLNLDGVRPPRCTTSTAPVSCTRRRS